jgi:hypothetical protein
MPAPATRTISDTAYGADGALYEGTLELTWSPFVSPDDVTIAGGKRQYTIVNGVVLIALVPGAYTARWLKSQTVETWTVPEGSGSLALADVR